MKFWWYFEIWEGLQSWFVGPLLWNFTPHYSHLLDTWHCEILLHTTLTYWIPGNVKSPHLLSPSVVGIAWADTKSVKVAILTQFHLVKQQLLQEVLWNPSNLRVDE